MANPTYILGPTKAKNRYTSIDILRDIALLGIIVMMVQSFSMPEATIINPTVYENLSGYDLYIWLVSHVFAYKKFEAIFAMLFGAGLVMLSQKAMREHLRSADLQNRRLIFLGLFGVLNAYLIWYGDVLLMFSICG